MSLSKPQYSQEWYVRQVHKNLLNKNGLPYTAAELYALPFRESVLKEYNLPLAIAVRTLRTRKFTERIRVAPHCCWWYVRRKHESLLNEYGLPHTVVDGTYVANTKLYWKNTVVAEWYIPCEHEVLRSALHVAMSAAMSEVQDRL